MKKGIVFLVVMILLAGLWGMAACENAPETQPRALIAYFSCTGNTKAAAETLSGLTGAALYAIEPVEPYTSADLNYNDSASRSNRECGDETARPAILNAPESLDEYDVIYLGYPIWWGDIPPIVRTFLEAYDFSGKIVMPFCTSGSSGVSTSVRTIRAFIPDADVRDGLRVTKNNGEKQFAEWIERERPGASADVFYIHVNEAVLTASFADNTSADALRALLAAGNRTIDMHDFSNFEKVGELGVTLPTNDERITTEPGDLILYLGQRFVIYYDTNTWDFTRLGKIQGADGAALLALLGAGDVTVTLSMNKDKPQ